MSARTFLRFDRPCMTCDKTNARTPTMLTFKIAIPHEYR